MHRSIASRIAFALCTMSLAAGCESPATPEERVPVIPPQAPTADVPDYAWPTQAWLDRTLGLSSYDDAQLAEIAGSPVLVIQMRLLFSEEARAPLARIRELNPEIVFIGILDNLMIHEVFGDASHRERFPLGAAIYDLYAPRIARTTTGDIPLMWEGAPMINPYASGGHDQGLVEDVLDLVSQHALERPGLLDGVFHDYLSATPYLFPGQTDVGEVDLDGDGVGANDDPDDQAAWLGFQQAMLDGLQGRFGEGLIQIANGRLPHRNADIAAAVAGIAYENFPTTVWGYTDLEGFELMLEHHEPGWLTPRRGRTWSLLWDRSGTKLEFCRTASALSGSMYCKDDRRGFVGADAPRGSLGQSSGPLVRNDMGGGVVRYFRAHENGSATIDFDSDGRSTTREILSN